MHRARLIFLDFEQISHIPFLLFKCIHLVRHKVKVYKQNYRQYTTKKQEQLEGECLNTLWKSKFRTLWSKKIPGELKIKFYPRELLF